MEHYLTFVMGRQTDLHKIYLFEPIIDCIVPLFYIMTKIERKIIKAGAEQCQALAKLDLLAN